MKLDQLRYFLETAQQGHIGKAANIIAISPSAISHSISSLEKELGRELFVKNGKNIALTGHGRLLMGKVRKLLAEVEAVRDEVAADHVELQGHYKIAATHLLSSKFLTPAWTKIQNENPGLTAEIYSLRSAQVVSAVASGEYDFGLCFNPQAHPNLEAQPVYRGQMVLAVNKKHPLLKVDAKDQIQNLSRYPASLPKAFQGVDNCESHPIFKKFGITPDIKFVFDSYDVAVEHLSTSQAWGLVPCWVVRSHKDKLTWIIPRGWNAPVTASALWLKNRRPTKVLKRLIAGVADRFKALP